MSYGIDPDYDMSRKLILESADKVSRYAMMVAELIEMRDDDAAAAMRATMVSQVKVMTTGFTALAAAHNASKPENAAASFFARATGSIPQ